MMRSPTRTGRFAPWHPAWSASGATDEIQALRSAHRRSTAGMILVASVAIGIGLRVSAGWGLVVTLIACGALMVGISTFSLQVEALVAQLHIARCLGEIAEQEALIAVNTSLVGPRPPPREAKSDGADCDRVTAP